MSRSDRHRADSPEQRPRTRAQRRAEKERVGPVPDIFLLALITCALAKSILTRGLTLGWSVAFSALWLDVAVITLLAAGAAVVFKHRSHLLMLGVYVVYSLLLFADTLYAGFFQTLLDPQMFRLAGQATEISDIIVGLLRPVYLLFFLDIPVLALWAVLLRKRHAVYKRSGAAIAAGLSFALLSGQLAFAAAVPEGTDSATIASDWGITSMQLASIGSMVAPRHKNVFAGVSAASRTGATETSGEPAIDPVDAFYSRMGKYAPTTPGQRIAPFPEGALKGKNVIIVQFESLEAMLINGKVEGQYVTPNVNKFIADSWFFPNTYAQTGIGNTADCEFTITTSMLPPLKQNATTAYADRVLPALPRMLNDKGYSTITLHTNAAHFWFRTDLYKSLAYQKWYDKSYFKDRDQMWRGSSDQVLFQDGMKALKTNLKSGKPILATFVTMTSHHEYGFPLEQSRRPLKLGPRLASSYAGKYTGAISYADKAFGEFISALKAADLYDDSIIILIGDHMGYKPEEQSSSDKAIVRQIIGREHTYVDHQRVAFAVHIPGQKPQVTKAMRASEDIMPTVADLLGLDLSKTPHFGRSVFVNGPRLIPMRAYFPGSSYVNSSMVFVKGATPGEDRAFNIFTNKEIKPPSRADSDLALVTQFNALADDWLMSQPVREGGVNRRLKSSGSGESE